MVKTSQYFRLRTWNSKCLFVIHSYKTQSLNETYESSIPFPLGVSIFFYFFLTLPFSLFLSSLPLGTCFLTSSTPALRCLTLGKPCSRDVSQRHLRPRHGGSRTLCTRVHCVSSSAGTNNVFVHQNSTCVTVGVSLCWVWTGGR